MKRQEALTAETFNNVVFLNTICADICRTTAVKIKPVNEQLMSRHELGLDVIFGLCYSLFNFKVKIDEQREYRSVVHYREPA